MALYPSYSEFSGNGSTKGTVVTTANDNTTGNVVLESGSTCEYTTSNNGTATYSTDVGIDFSDTATNQTPYFILTRTPATAMVLRAYFKPKGAPVTDNALVAYRASGSFMGYIRHRSSGVLQVSNVSNTIIGSQATPALIDDHTYQIDHIWKRGTTTTNGRSIFMVTDLDSNSWSSGGVFYYDTGDTISSGTVDPDTVRLGKTSAVQAPSFNLSYFAWTGSTTIPAQATANSDMSIGRPLFLPPKYGFFLWDGTNQEPLDLQEGNSSVSPPYLHPYFQVALAPLEIRDFSVGGVAPTPPGFGQGSFGTNFGN